MKTYNKQNIPLAKELRKNMTPWERKLWYQYLNKYPVRFQRQKAIGNFIADFYCAKARLVIELDGGGHYESTQAAADAERTKNLESMNLQVLRICNTDIDKNFRGVCEFIDRIVQNSLPQSAPPTAPSSEEACIRRTQCPKIFALGFFDGVHLGHQALLAECVRLAAKLDAEPAAITFDRHPQALFTQNSPALINTNTDRDTLLHCFGIRHIHRLAVTAEVMSTPWQEFLQQLLDQGAVGFVCGDDFRFGHKGEGNGEKLTNFCAERGLPCVIVSEQSMDGVRISSSYIRKCLEMGDVETAGKFLGHTHILSGEVVPGRQLGRTLGIPTANLRLPERVVCPKFGVYACRACVDGQIFPAVTNIGVRPTVSGEGITVEPWILGFTGDLYGKTITLEFHKFLRPEQKFGSLEELKAEIQKNAEETRRLLR